MGWLTWFGEDEAWQRPRPALQRQDWLVALAVLVFEVVTLELIRSFADFSGAKPLWAEYLLLVSLFPLVLLRRRWPVSCGLGAFVVLYGSGNWVPEIGMQLSFQMVCFGCFYSMLAWARDRRAAALASGLMLVALLAWVAVDFAFGQAIESYRRVVEGAQVHGLLPGLPAWVLYTYLVNLLFMVGSVAMGQAAWRQARDRARLAAQAETIQHQSQELSDQAVGQERLRIARELHDVVAHHVSVMGIQAAGARRLLQRDPATAAQALEQVEASSREAVGQMRGLLGALRGSEPVDDQTRAPAPTLEQLPALYAGLDGLEVEQRRVEHPPGAAGELALPMQLQIYRVVQESLTNVRRHSTARKASVTLRVERGWAEVEVLDAGSPRPGSSGSGLGHLGMRERVRSMGGIAEIGPRVTGGFRVRVRFPLEARPTTPPAN